MIFRIPVIKDIVCTHRPIFRCFREKYLSQYWNFEIKEIKWWHQTSLDKYWWFGRSRSLSICCIRSTQYRCWCWRPRTDNETLLYTLINCETKMIHIHLEHEVTKGFWSEIRYFELNQTLLCHVIDSLHCTFDLYARCFLLRSLLCLLNNNLQWYLAISWCDLSGSSSTTSHHITTDSI